MAEKKKTTKKKVTKKKAKEKEDPKPKKDPKEEEEDFIEKEDTSDWTEDLIEDDNEAPEEVDIEKLKFTKLKDLSRGMEHINIEATIDFVGEPMTRGYGEDPFAIGFLKDSTGEIKISFWSDDIKKAKPKKKVRVIDCGVGEFRGQLQVYPNRKRGIEFI
ncbi:hypothetical protein ACFL3V_07260 [Nanoarchaeota archaeon]